MVVSIMYHAAFVIFFSLSINIAQVGSFAIAAAGIASLTAIAGSLFAILPSITKCRFSPIECCCEDSPWMQPNFTGMALEFETRLHGQHLVKSAVLQALKAHLKTKEPSKALVLSLHGWTGSGKNFVANMIADNIFHMGTKSSYYHLLVTTVHFPLASQHSEDYKRQLQSWIRGNVSRCERSLFVFDEVDKMSAGLLDALKPFLDHHKAIDGVDYRKSIFLFLSNTAGSELTKHTLKHWQAGGKRTDLTLKEMEAVIVDEAFNDKGGLWHSELIDKHLISVFVPFLPLERRHVARCIKDALRARGVPIIEAFVRQVADGLVYFPDDSLLYSTSGCKKVNDRVSFELAAEDDDDDY